MCGIAGAINYNLINDSSSLGKDITSSLYHRGPDEQRYITYKNVLLAHTRLAIQDIDNGSQPFEIEGFSLIFNGEIYNHINLRKKFLSHISFKTNSDSETILYLYKKYKEKMFDFIDGMFALAILDKNNNNLILAVDRAGKKPLYFYNKEKIFFFSSELNTISSIIDLSINDEYINSYLRCGFFYKETTPYNNVHRLNAGSFANINLDDLQFNQCPYFNLLDKYKKYNQKSEISFDKALNKTKNALNKSIKNRLISSDLEVGAFLSGGIDSSLVVSMASKILDKPIKTFTVSFEDSKSYDESSLALLVAKKYNTEHRKISINMNNLKYDIDNILHSYGEPFFDSSAIPSFYVSKEAKNYINVVLNGDGADELFGGYRRYVGVKYNSFFKPFSPIANILKPPNNKQSLYNYLYRALKISSKKGLDFYLSASTDIFEDIYSFDKNQTLDNFNNEIMKVFNTNLDDVSKMLYLDFANILYSDLLKKIDIASMHYAIESRSPFLSKYMIDVSAKIPSKYKMHNFTTKYILRELAKEYLPKELINAPKRGFEIPLAHWVDNDLRDNIFSSLHNGYHENFINKKFMQKLIDKKLNISNEKRAKILWSIFCLNKWYINKNRKNIK